MIARRLRPASPSSLLDRQDRAITSARPRAVSRHVGRTRRRNHDGGATRTGGFVKADRIVGGIRRHLSEGAVDRLDQRDASRRVVDARLRQGPGRRSHPTGRHRDAASSSLASPVLHASPRPIHPRPRARGPCCRQGDAGRHLRGRDAAGGRDAGHAGRAWCDRARTGRDPASRRSTSRCLLLIRLFQHATTGSVRAWRARRFRRISASFHANSPPKRLVRTTWRRVAGRTVLRVPGAGMRAAIDWSSSGAGNVRRVGIRYR